jgi:MOSC domain-containing protein YiiM
MPSQVVAVHFDTRHAFSKQPSVEVELVANRGVRCDAHFGVTVQHRSRVAKDPTQPNLRQVHLLHEELLIELQAHGFRVEPGQMGENITTRGLAVLALSEGTKLKVGEKAVLRVTGLRNPCSQIESFRPGLLASVLDRAEDGALVRKAGVMCVVEQGGHVRAGDPIIVLAQPDVHIPLQPV